MLLVFGVVFVWVTRLVCLLLWEIFSVGACELSTVYNRAFLCGFVALCGEVLDLTDNRFAGKDFTEYNVLAVEMWGWDGCDEELTSVGACAGLIVS